MISWPQILYGVALTAWARPCSPSRCPLAPPGAGRNGGRGGGAGGPGWQVVLPLTHARVFFTDLAFRSFPVSWQDTGSGVTTLAVTALTFVYGRGAGILRQRRRPWPRLPARRPPDRRLPLLRP